MAIQLNFDQQRIVGRAIQVGLIRTADDVVQIGVEAIQRKLETSPISESASQLPSRLSGAENWSRELDAWVHAHDSGSRLLPDDATGRDSIYDTRGL